MKKVIYYDELFGEIDALNFYEKNKDIVSTRFVNILKRTKEIWDEKKSNGVKSESSEVYKAYTNATKYCLAGIEGSKKQDTAPRLYVNLQSAKKGKPIYRTDFKNFT